MNIKQFMKEKGVSVEQLAQDACVHVRTVYRWLDGTRTIRPRDAKLLTLLYGEKENEKRSKNRV